MSEVKKGEEITSQCKGILCGECPLETNVDGIFDLYVCKLDEMVVVPEAIWNAYVVEMEKKEEKCQELETTNKSLSLTLDAEIESNRELKNRLEKIKTLIDNIPNGLELDVSDIPSINVPMLKGTKFLLFRKDTFVTLKEELRGMIKG
jgi:hypothetical protein